MFHWAVMNCDKLTLCCEIRSMNYLYAVNCFRYWLSVGARPSKPVAILLGLVSWQHLRVLYVSSSHQVEKNIGPVCRIKTSKKVIVKKGIWNKVQSIKWLHLHYLIKRIALEPCTPQGCETYSDTNSLGGCWCDLCAGVVSEEQEVSKWLPKYKSFSKNKNLASLNHLLVRYLLR